MKQRFYIDTSVFGGNFDEEFSEFTRPLFEKLQKGEFKLLFSAVTQDELSSAPDKVKKLVTSLREENTEYVETNDEAVELATQYIAEKVVGQTSIVNVQKIRGYNAINIKNGYKELEIRSPRDFMTYEDNS